MQQVQVQNLIHQSLIMSLHGRGGNACNCNPQLLEARDGVPLTVRILERTVHALHNPRLLPQHLVRHDLCWERCTNGFLL
jgi:hypothetical protein